MPYSNYVFTSSLLCRLYSVYKLQLIYYAIIRAKRCLYECKQPKVKLNNKNKRIMSQRMVDLVERNKIYYYSFIQNMSLFLTNLNPLHNSSQLYSLRQKQLGHFHRTLFLLLQPAQQARSFAQEKFWKRSCEDAVQRMGDASRPRECPRPPNVNQTNLDCTHDNQINHDILR